MKEYRGGDKNAFLSLILIYICFILPPHETGGQSPHPKSGVDWIAVVDTYSPFSRSLEYNLLFCLLR